MTVVFQIKNIEGWYTTDPEVVQNSRHIEVGDYVRLPDGKIFLFEKDYPAVFTEVLPEKVPTGVVVLDAQEYDMLRG